MNYLRCLLSLMITAPLHSMTLGTCMAFLRGSHSYGRLFNPCIQIRNTHVGFDTYRRITHILGIDMNGIDYQQESIASRYSSPLLEAPILNLKYDVRNCRGVIKAGLTALIGVGSAALVDIIFTSADLQDICGANYINQQLLATLAGSILGNAMSTLFPEEPLPHYMRYKY